MIQIIFIKYKQKYYSIYFIKKLKLNMIQAQTA